MLRQTISLEIFERLSSTNLTWPVLEYLGPCDSKIQVFDQVFHTSNLQKFEKHRMCYFQKNPKTSKKKNKTNYFIDHFNPQIFHPGKQIEAQSQK